MLSEDTAAQLVTALRDHCYQASGSSDRLGLAIADAAVEARSAGVSAERFVIWLKQVWEELVHEGMVTRQVDPSRVRDAVISAAIKAYYVQ
ncbi:MAG TPA: hypothetical protein VIG47_05455 [Gemmatimonadaceae bacterium]